jgi:hypothetical protein
MKNKLFREKYDAAFERDNKHIYFYYSDKSNITDIIKIQLRFNYFLRKMHEYMKKYIVHPTRYKIINRFAEYLFMEKGIPTFSKNNLEYFRLIYTPKALIIDNCPSFDEFVEQMKQIVKIAEGMYHNNIEYIISDKNPEKYFLKIQPKNYSNRLKVGYTPTKLEIVTAILTYYNVLKYMAEGNQWALDDNTLNKLQKLDFRIEVFGSPFNTRLQYFGSLYKTIDEPFGSLGNYDEILLKLINKEKIYWKDKLVYNETELVKIQIGPPSVFELIYNLWNLILKLFESRDTIIQLGIPDMIFNDEIMNSKYFKKHWYPTEFISFEQNLLIKFNIYEEHEKIKKWHFYWLSNIDFMP